MFERLVSNEAVLGAYFTILILELVNWVFTVVWALGVYLDSGSAVNFAPFLFPMFWPIVPLLELLDPSVGTAVGIVAAFVCYFSVVALLFRWTPESWTLERRKKAVLYSAVGFSALYVISFPFLFVWNA